MNIAAGLSGLKAAGEMAKALRDGLKAGQIKPDEIAGRIGEIYDYIIDSKMALVDAQEEISSIKERYRQLESRLEFRDRVKFEGGAQWLLNKDGTRQGPFCPSCWGLNEKLVRPSRGVGESAKHKSFFCSHHSPNVKFKVDINLLE